MTTRSVPPEGGTARPTAVEESDGPLARLLADPIRRSRVTHVRSLPARAGRTTDWPGWAHPLLVERLEQAGIGRPWEHQARAASAAHAGASVVIATGTASGKSLAYLLPVVSAVLSGDGPGRGARPVTALYIAPTKALAADQLRAVAGLKLPDVAAACLDGDTPMDERRWIREHAAFVLTNPDMLHHAVLPNHARWAAYLRALRYVVVDECHAYRGVFGSHVAQVLRRLRRVCAHYGASPAFVLASATVAAAGEAATRLTGTDVVEVVEDTSKRGPMTFVLWEPPLTEAKGERRAPVRRTATAESADILAGLVADEVRTVAFVRSRVAAEAVSVQARDVLGQRDRALAERVAAYRAGYLPEDRRALEGGLHAGTLLGMAATTALELGVDVSGLDAVVMAGYPGTRASVWQQAGRAGRDGRAALAVLVARDDPLDTYLVHHPEALFDAPVEATVLDPDNPHVLWPHLCAAAAEIPLRPDELELFGPTAPAVVGALERRKLLRGRPAGWFWTGQGSPVALADIRGSGGTPVSVIEESTGRLLGTVDAAAAPTTVHAGAVHLHQGETYLVSALDLDEAVALVEAADPGYATFARTTTDVHVLRTDRTQEWGRGRLHLGMVEVTTHIVSFLKRRVLTGQVLGEEPLDLPDRTLTTRAVWWTVSPEQTAEAALTPADLPGAAHAAEHASIGLLPLFATCDRWDIGGVSTALHDDTGLPTVFVYDGHPGGAGFAERAFDHARAWLHATATAIRSCECADGCPSCVQSPKCGNGNNPLDKPGAIRLLDALLAEAV